MLAALAPTPGPPCPESLYRRRRPRDTILHQTLDAHLDGFLAQVFDQQRSLPVFVERELRALLDCGVLARGFVRLRCATCRRDMAVAFSCKCRGVCPSCAGRRMADTAAHWRDHVLPRVPMRQWVLSLPFPLRLLLAYDPRRCTEVLGIFLRTLFSWQRLRARRMGIPGGQSGAVTAIQRFGSALNLNVHFHCLSFDGVYVQTHHQRPPRFQELPAPTDGEVAQLVAAIHQRVIGHLRKKGLLGEPGHDDPTPDMLSLDESTLAAFYSASIQGRVATGPRSGSLVERYGGLHGIPFIEVESPRSARVGGFSLDASVSIAANDRERLERVSRYMLRPALSHDRFSRTTDGKIAYALKRPYSDGTTHVVFTPFELIEKLAALIPRPQKNTVRYHGVFAPNHSWRRHIVPSGDESDPKQPEPPQTRRRSRRSWADLMARVFAIDVLACTHCGSRMKVICTITDPKVIGPFLASLARREEATHPARPPPPAEQPAEITHRGHAQSGGPCARHNQVA